MVENPGVDPNNQIQLFDSGSGQMVTRRFAKFLEKSLLVSYTQAHGGGKFVSPIQKYRSSETPSQIASGTKFHPQAR